jgi:hypothetical protein
METTETVKPETVKPTKKEYFEVRVYVKGIKRRCRKPEFKGLKLPNAPLNVGSDNEKMESIKKDARLLIELTMKEVLSEPYLSFQYGHECEHDSGMIMSYPFDEKNFKVKL